MHLGPHAVWAVSSFAALADRNRHIFHHRTPHGKHGFWRAEHSRLRRWNAMLHAHIPLGLGAGLHD